MDIFKFEGQATKGDVWLIAAVAFIALTATQETAANYGFDWRAWLPKPRPAAPAGAGG